MRCSQLLSTKDSSGRYAQFADRVFSRLSDRYHALLEWCMDHRWKVISISFLVFLGSLGIAWLLIATTRATPIGGGFGSLDQVAQMLRDPWFVVMGWQHALILDLFVGAWEARDAQRLGIPHGYVVPCLVFTFLAGPVGLIGYFVVRVAVVRRWPC